jgi:CDP-glucose 4,6-dehydratase
MKDIDLFSGIYKNKKILITGDTGFKGSWMAIWLNELGAHVYGYALAPQTSQDNFVTTKLSKKIKHKDGDIRDKDTLINYFKKVKPDIVFHLAAQPLVIDSYNDPHYNFETNVMGTVNFFEAVRNCNSVKVAVNITTDKCYLNNDEGMPFKESDSLGGNDPYSASKACSEIITHSYFNSFFKQAGHISIASARAGNVIGGGDWADNRIIPDLMRAYNKGDVLKIRNPESVRPWQHVLEPVYGYLKLGAMMYLHGNKFSGAWNFGPDSKKSYSVGDVVNRAKKMLPELNTEIIKETNKVHEAALLNLDISKAKKHLKWKPRLNFDQTLEFTITGYLDEFNNLNKVYDCRVEQIKQYCVKK